MTEQLLVEDPVPEEVRAVMELFAGQLAQVAFPDVDARSLKREADELRSEAKTVERARAALEAVLAAHAARKAALVANARRAIAYAQIYSEAHPDRATLAGALAAVATIGTTTTSATPVAKRRGRPPKRSAELFDAPPTLQLVE